MFFVNNYLKCVEQHTSICNDFCFLIQVHINVIDINDNSPLFLSTTYKTTIGENTPIGLSILKVSAVDKDEDNRLFYTISAAENAVSNEKFEINSRTGNTMFVYEKRSCTI